MDVSIIVLGCSLSLGLAGRTLSFTLLMQRLDMWIAGCRWWAGSGRQLFLPSALAYAPQLGMAAVHPMSLLQRVQNSATYLANSLADYFLLRPFLLRAW